MPDNKEIISIQTAQCNCTVSRGSES